MYAVVTSKTNQDNVGALETVTIAWVCSAFHSGLRHAGTAGRPADYTAALHHLNQAYRALRKAQSRASLWHSTYEKTTAALRSVNCCHDALVADAGDLRPALSQQRGRYIALHPDVFAWVVSRILTDAAGLSKRRAYALIADLEASIRYVHVDPIAIRKRLKRSQTSTRRLFCAAWEMMLFDVLRLETTKGLVPSDPKTTELFTNISSLEIKDHEQAVTAKRHIHDLHEMQAAIKEAFDPFIRTSQWVTDEYEAVQTSLNALTKLVEHVQNGRTGEPIEAAVLAEMARVLDEVESMQSRTPQLERYRAAVDRLFGGA